MAAQDSTRARPGFPLSGSAVRGVPRPTARANRLPEAVVSLDDQFADIVGMLDRSEVLRRMVARVPDLVGLDLAWLGDPGGPDAIVLRHTVNNNSDSIDGLVVPAGIGLGGRVLATRQPFWVSDYCAAAGIPDYFKNAAAAEAIRAMIAVPIIAAGQLRGVLYAASRSDTDLGDRVALALERVAARTGAAELIAERARLAAHVAVHEERRRLAMELHDTVGAMLFTLGAGIRRLGADPEIDGVVRSRLSDLEQQTAEAAAALRGSLRILSAPPERVALGVALREHCRAFQDRTGVPAQLITLTELPALDASRIDALADAVREALLNVEKHADARWVVVSVFVNEMGVAVTVSDDGIGLAADVTTRAGLGLAAVTRALARVGGSLTIGPNDDRGVTVHAWLPA